MSVAWLVALPVQVSLVPTPKLRAITLPLTATLPHTSPLVMLRANSLAGLPERKTL
jgi:hypothetical protein